MKDEEIAALFFDVAKRSRQLRDHGILPLIGQYRCLCFLEEEGEMTQKQLAEKMEIRPASMSELLYKLEKKGFIERRSSLHDKRSVVVSLSESGKAEVLSFYEKRKKAHCELLSALQEEEKALFGRLLLKIQEHYRKKDER